ncbi:MAG: response regulator [Acidobacteria bacterium]|nr:response regulator [Acidobacteriota bacterium]
MAVLVAEGNPADVFMLRSAISASGIDCSVKVVEDGAGALGYIQQLEADEDLGCPDLVLLDLHLSRFDGHEVLRRLRASERCSHVPVIVMTGSESPEERASAESFGRVAYFRKPPHSAGFEKIGKLAGQFLKEAALRKRTAS